MIKVAIMINSFSTGGAQRVVSELIKNLDQKEISLRVICFGCRVDTAMAKEVEKIANVEYLNISGRIALHFPKVFKSLNAFQPDVVHVHLSSQVFAIPWGFINRKPVIITAHTKPEKAFIKKVEPLIRWGLKSKKVFIVAVSQKNLKLVKNYFETDERNCCCINNGIDINSFYRVNHDHFTFINVSRQDENKNQTAILRCFAKLHVEKPGVRLILLGDGPCHEKLCALAKELGIEAAVVLPGAKDNVAEFLAVSDAYVQFSHREAMPMSVLEAMAAGLPVISSDVGGMRDIVHGNGYLIDDNNEEMLFNVMKVISEKTHEELLVMETESRKVVSCYSADSMSSEYSALYRKLCSNEN